MIAVDPSALLAILFDEPERDQFLAALDGADEILISSASVVEARMVAFGRHGDGKVAAFDELIGGYAIQIVPPGPDEIDLAHSAFTRYGKGSGHPAQLNFGDLFSYALAKQCGAPLLFKGGDFARTDVARA